jgi:DNA end-binding protein Ku
MPARATWTGVISFGLVSLPVEMYSAVREHEVSFHQFQRGTTDRIRYQRINERTGEEVDFSQIIKGTDVGDGEYVMFEPEDLVAVAPGRSKILEIHQFVDLDEIDPIYFQKTYYLVPGSDETVGTYCLLRDAMTDAGRAAVATFVMRGKEYLCAVRVEGDLMLLETMYFADEIRDPKAIADRMPTQVRARPQELLMAGKLIDSMTGPWRPEDYRDTYTDRIKELIEAKKAGEEVTTVEDVPRPTNVIDLMDVLRRSVDNARRRRTSPASSAPASASASASDEDDLAGKSKSALTELARGLNIPGRSTMDRDELRAAVAKARKRRAA